MRVVITGMGTVNALGHNVDEFWAAIQSGKSGVDYITHFDTEGFTTKIAAEVKNLEPGKYLDPKVVRKYDPFSTFAVISADEAWKQAGLEGIDPTRVGCILGVGIGGFKTIEENFHAISTKGPRRVHPLSVPKIMINTASANIAIHLNAQGPSYTVSTACASSTDAIGHSMRVIQSGLSDVVISGGAEAIITPLPIAAFNSLHALSSAYNDQPKRASRPFDRDRDGFVMGEGAGIIILENLEHAQKRGARIYGEVVAHGSSTDADHITAPHPQGRGAVQAIRNALAEAGLTPEHIDYINAHGTATPINDPIETSAIKTVFDDHAYKLKISSSKSMTGHCIGAAGALEAIICTKAIQDQFYPPTINYENPDPECDLDYVPNTGYNGDITYAMSNSFGFGGHNSILVIKKYEEK